MRGIAVRRNISLKKYGTFRIGGRASFFVSVKTEEELLLALEFAGKNSLKIFILGRGSNVLFADEGFAGLVIKIDLRGLRFFEGPNKVLAEVQAGEDWDNFVKKTVDKNYWGLENLSYIPGTVGAAPIQNIGSYGVEVGDLIKEVHAINIKNLKKKIFSKKKCRFSYRHSFFKTAAGADFVITDIVFSLKKTEKANLSYRDLEDFFAGKDRASVKALDVRKALKIIRGAKFPDLKKFGTAGSFFRNPVVSVKKFKILKSKYPDLPEFYEAKGCKLSLAFILDRVCGLRGYKLKNAGLYKNQPLVFVNFGGAEARDILNLGKKVRKKVFEKTGVEIFAEVTFVG
ncbi:UDP-N-acetylenolpyruvoylglucosamine reductase [Candidatus Campbellbacteria bacterium CG11_big_fil_rev_8_21_14_0_20_44_21]|uniref:UDP-N-acetylenolpyruvoylglucosamine reductase n=1 Tax=Candidatus Campbellbacteria bacterium CG22_combo_CG10-13_8_21_14_all_43_18 TaxID=1974530 RepID=A0A2H0DWB2_9BACT|nr:MAG: UDP-N-acetylenolpyruvoylglucosamine reductase [Candidatus Campbellbacteria bacterium CG22_combo_CG10-13_8_21_14_all_43_18]PIR24038.1 MAG: UDP-N-acetylenolpyruvoylglucosamine reductase [Candidatus Campbellbacteria bacterium CG11_big_fil_rev_8_21_14_0_20_44_21]